MEVGKTYRVVYSDNGMGMHVNYDTVECLAVLPKTYRVLGKRSPIEVHMKNKPIDRVYLIRKENIIEIEEIV